MASRLKGSVDRTAIALMFGALTLLLLFVATLVPDWAKLGVVFVSGLFISAVMAEEELQKALILFVVCTAGGLLITSGIDMMAPYIFFCGWYAIAKYALDGMEDKFNAWCIKFAIYNIAMGICCYFFPEPMFQPLMGKLPVFAVVLLAELALPIYDLILWFFSTVYSASLRRHL